MPDQPASEHASATAEAESLILDALAPDAEFGPVELERMCSARPDLAAALRVLFERLTRSRAILSSAAALRLPRDGAPSAVIGGRFHVLDEIGRGGMSIVMLAWDQVTRRKVALKCVRAPRGGAPSAAAQLEHRRARLLHEAQVLAQLDHPSIVPVYDVFRDADGGVFIAMLRVRGVDLREIYARCWNADPEWSLARIVAVLQRTCEAVAYAHQKRVLHRDLKPANVMVGAFGESYVMDWGLARTRCGPPDALNASAPSDRPVPEMEYAGAPAGSMVLTDRDCSDSRWTSYTHEGDVLGTPGYMSPEQATGQLDAVDARTDQYGIGAMLYELLAQHAPYARPGRPRSVGEALSALRSGPPVSLSACAPRAPPELVAITERAMARDREERYASMLDLARDLRAFLEGHVVQAHRTGAWVEARKWMQRHSGVVSALAALLCTLLAGGIALALLYRESEERRTRLQTAQIDSLRRINALRGFAPAGLPTPGFVEEFEGPHLHRRWISSSRPDLVSLRDGALVLRSEGHALSNTTVELDPNVALICGDFDLRVHFRLEGFDSEDVPRAGRIASLLLYSAISGRNAATVQREVDVDPPPQVPSVQFYRSFDASSDQYGSEHLLASDDRHGVLRVERRGGEIVASVLQADWHELFRAAVSSDPFTIHLLARNWYAEEPFEFAIERVELNCKQNPVLIAAPFEEHFERVELDPRFSLSSRAGLAAVVDGCLFLETFAGLEGHSQVALDPTRWRLTGDFEVEVDVDLLELDAAGEVRVDVSALSGESFGAVQFLRTEAGRVARGVYHRETREHPLQAERARVSIVRSGTDLALRVRSGTEKLALVERPHVDTALDFYFSLNAVSSADSAGVVAAFDDLRLSTLSQR